MNTSSKIILTATLALVLVCAPLLISGADARSVSEDGTEYDEDLGEFWSYTIGFSYNGQGARSITWDFGDGSEPVTAWSDIHTYEEKGVYYVTQTAHNTIGDSVAVYKVTVLGYPYVEFDSQGGTQIDRIDMTAGGINAVPATEPEEVPTKAGFTFTGWYTTSDCSTLYDWSQVVDEPVTLYAGWTENAKATITFDVDDGQPPVDPVQVTIGTQYTIPGYDGSKEGFTFGGWSDGQTTYLEGQQITVSDDMTLTAVWNALDQYTVTFNTDGGSAESPQTVYSGSTATEPEADPTKVGHTFAGWFTADGEPFDFESPITQNTTVYAHWTANIYTVTFDSAGGSAVESQQVAYGSTATEPEDPTRSSYTFVGWLLNGARFSFTTPITDNITLVADWSYNQPPVERHTVTFDPANGEDTWTSTVVDGGNVSMTVPVWEGHIFDGWFDADGVEYTEDTPIDGDVSLTAKWRTTANVVIDDSEGGSFTGIDGEVDIGGSIELPDASKEGSDLVGWDTDGDGVADAQPGDSVTVEDDTTLVPVWEDLPDDAQQDRVTIDADGGSSDFDEWFTEDGKLTLPDASKDGSDLVGWDTDGDGSVDAQPGDVIDVEDGDTVTAVWDRLRHTVTYDYGDSTTTRTVSDGSRAPMPADPVREGFAFGGWLLDGAEYDFSTPVKADITLVAQWNEIVSIVIDNSAGGSFTPIDGEVVAGDTIRLPEATKDGQQLAGWDTDGDGVADAQPGDLVQIDEDTTLTPVWEDIPEGTEQDRVIIEDSGDLGMDEWWTTDGTIPLPEPSKDGEVFLGWDTDGDGVADAQPGDTVEVEDGQTITGIWRPAEDVDVTIDVEDGVSVSGDIPEDLKEGDTVVLPDASKEDQKLTGWDTDGDGAVDAQPGDEIVVSGDTTLTPVWEDLAEDDVQNTVEIDDGTGSGSTWWTENDESMTVPEAPSRDGQVFEGWVDSDGNVYQPGDVIVPEGDMTLTAQWSDAPADDSDGPNVLYLVGAVACAIVAGVLAVVFYKEIREWYVLVGMIVAVVVAIVLALFYAGVL